MQQVVGRYSGKVRFVSENLGASKFAERFGVKLYPAVFVDDVLIARPTDFGAFGGEKGGRYAPWRNAANQARFKVDLNRMVDLVLAGKKEQASRDRPAAENAPDSIAALPNLALKDLAGQPLTGDQLGGRPVLVEFWATWCPPCRSTLEWLAGLKRKYGDNIAVVTLAVESPEADVRATAESIGAGLSWAISDAETGRSFGDISAVPTLFLFDRDGKTASVLYGAPPDLHHRAEKTLNALVN